MSASCAWHGHAGCRPARRNRCRSSTAASCICSRPAPRFRPSLPAMPVEQRRASPWGLPGSYDPKRKLLYWGVANPDPYTRLTRHGRYDAVPFTSPVNLYSNSTLALDVATGKLAWYYQELPGDDWDADHNQERILTKTRVNPDPRPLKGTGRSIPRDQHPRA